MSESGALGASSERGGAQAPRAFHLLLRVYPPAFRARYGDRLVRAFVAERRSGRRRGIVFWSWIVRDTLTAGLAERLGRRAGPATPPRPPRIEMVRDLLHDVRYAARALLSTPTFTVVALVILTLGIGANAIVFTLVNTLFFTDAPGLRAPDELVRVTRTHEQSRSASWGYPDFVYARDNTRTLSGLAAFEGRSAAATFSTDGEGDPIPVTVQMVSAGYFDVLGVSIDRGRGFGPEQAEVDGDGMVLVASHGFWRTALGARPDVVGDTVYVNGRSFRILGVAAEGFRGPGPLDAAPDFWAPLTAQPVLRADGSEAWLRRVPHQRINWLSVIGRLAPGVTADQARAEMRQLNEQLRSAFPEDNENLGIGVWEDYGLTPRTHDEMLRTARLLGAVVLMVLMIVCANIAVLQLARASHRQREVGIRFALGAGRGRVVRQLLTESLLLAGVGALAGFALAFAGARAVGAWLPVGATVEFRPDPSVLLFSIVVAVVVALAFGLAPALMVTRKGGALAVQSRTVIGGRERLRAALVAGQVAVSLVLVLGAALFVRSLLAAEAVDPGFATENRVFASVFTGSLGYTDDEQNALVDRVLERLGARPEVEHASVSVMVPFQGTWSTDFDPTGSDDEDAPTVTALANAVGPDYFETMGIPVLAGRPFDAGDRGSGDGVLLVVNEALAQMLWPGESPLGKAVALRSDEPVDRVVGVVANTDYQQLGEDPQPIAYTSIYQSPMPRLVFVAGTDGDVAALSRVVQEEILAADRNLAIASVLTIEEAIETQIGTYRLGARAVGTFGLLAAVLAAVGLYGVLSYVVASGAREIGIRMALGATEAGVLRRVVVSGLRIAGVGVAVGLAAALLTARFLAGMLYQIRPYDPVSFVLVPVLLLGVAAAASLVPARRASGVDPVEALRAE